MVFTWCSQCRTRAREVTFRSWAPVPVFLLRGPRLRHAPAFAYKPTIGLMNPLPLLLSASPSSSSGPLSSVCGSSTSWGSVVVSGSGSRVMARSFQRLLQLLELGDRGGEPAALTLVGVAQVVLGAAVVGLRL